MFFIKEALILSCFIAVGITKTVNEDAIADCGKYNEVWRMVMCAASLSKDKIISDGVLAIYLREALRRLPADVTAYAFGITVGESQELFVGKINNPDIDSYFSINYNVREWRNRQVRYYSMVDTQKPILVFTNSNIDNVPEWNSAKYLSIEEGSEAVKNLYRVGSGTTNVVGTPENCGKLQTFVAEEKLINYKNIAIVLPSEYWCSRVTGGVGEVVVADMIGFTYKSGKETRQAYRSSYAVSSKEVYGDAPDALLSVFQ